MEFPVGNLVFVFVLDSDGNVIEIQVPALGNGFMPFTIGANPAITVAAAEAEVTALFGSFGG